MNSYICNTIAELVSISVLAQIYDGNSTKDLVDQLKTYLSQVYNS